VTLWGSPEWKARRTAVAQNLGSQDFWFTEYLRTALCGFGGLFEDWASGRRQTDELSQGDFLLRAAEFVRN
jgi:hypothetical protein